MQIWMIWVLELIYYLLFKEVGRVGDNFIWGIRMANYLIMIVSIRLFWQNVLQAKQKNLNGRILQKKDILYLATIGFLLIWELSCGIYYFVHLLVGSEYMI